MLSSKLCSAQRPAQRLIVKLPLHPAARTQAASGRDLLGPRQALKDQDFKLDDNEALSDMLVR